MKKIYTILILFFAGNFFVAAQSSVYHKTFGGPNNEEGFDVIATSDGGYAMIGSTGSYGAGDLDVLLVKLDSVAEIQWSHVYGGAGSDQALSLVQTIDGGFAICGAVWIGRWKKGRAIPVSLFSRSELFENMVENDSCAAAHQRAARIPAMGIAGRGRC